MLSVFLDRDGVLNELRLADHTGTFESPYSPGDVALCNGVESLAVLNELGFMLFCISNQPAAAQGITTIAGIIETQQRVLELVKAKGVEITASYVCIHHPNGIEPVLTGECECRKPKPGLIFRAAEDYGINTKTSWLIGDTDADIAAGLSAGCRTIYIDSNAAPKKRTGDPKPLYHVNNLVEAVSLIIEGADI